MFANDPFGRNIWGTPPQGRADYAFFQHIVCSMKPNTGRCAILFPHGVLFRDEEREMREKLVKSDVVECIIGLGPNLFFNASMEACIVICNMNKKSNRKGKVLFIDALNEVTRKNAQSYLEPKHIDKIVSAYDAFQDDIGFSAVVSLDEIVQNKAELRIAAYVENKTSEQEKPQLDFEAVLELWQKQSAAMKQAYQAVLSQVK